MPESHSRPVPMRLDADRWTTRRAQKRVLVVVHTVIAGQRLLDALRLLEGDVRIQTVFTQAPDVFGHGVPEFLKRLGALVLPWGQAVETAFDLALAASYGGLHELHAPVVVLPHGAGHNKLVPAGQQGRTVAPRGVYGLSRQRLVRDGSVIPESIVLAHHEEVTRLGVECPEAVPIAKVVGDPCFDRIATGLPARAPYRAALGVGDDQKLLLVCSTWGPDSLLGRDWELLERLAGELPADEYRVAALLHPHIWNAHGDWQVRTWFAPLVRAGLVLVSPWADWTGAVVAADHVVGDHGSVTLYGTMTGVPLTLGGRPDPDIDPNSPLGELMSFAPRLDGDRPVRDQLAKSAETREADDRYERVAARITSEPGRFHRRMRALLYDKLRLQVPRVRVTAEAARMPFAACHDVPGGGVAP